LLAGNFVLFWVGAKEGVKTSFAPNRNGSSGDHVMAKSRLPCPTLLRQLLRYEPETGALFWKPRSPDLFDQTCRYPAQRIANRWNSQFAGKPALACINDKGYPHGHLLRVIVTAHRVIWAMQTGAWPTMQLDHINGVRHDNRIENLREVTLSENMRNAAIPSNNKSGCIGVWWMTSHKSWRASIGVDRKIVWLGNYKNLEDAIAARRAAEITYGYHSNHGRPARQ
jgi:hypothetical protein